MDARSYSGTDGLDDVIGSMLISSPNRSKISKISHLISALTPAVLVLQLT